MRLGIYFVDKLIYLWLHWTKWNHNLVDIHMDIRHDLHGIHLKMMRLISQFHLNTILGNATICLTIIFHKTMNLRKIANINVGQNGIIIRQTSTCLKNLCEKTIRVTIEIRIIIEKSAKKIKKHSLIRIDLREKKCTERN